MYEFYTTARVAPPDESIKKELARIQRELEEKQKEERLIKEELALHIIEMKTLMNKGK